MMVEYINTFPVELLTPHSVPLNFPQYRPRQDWSVERQLNTNLETLPLTTTAFVNYVKLVLWKYYDHE